MAVSRLNLGCRIASDDIVSGSSLFNCARELGFKQKERDDGTLSIDAMDVMTSVIIRYF